MTPDWTPLAQELQIWRAQDLSLPLWWRDDDAIQPTRALDQLAALSDTTGLPVHLAVIPQAATQALADGLPDRMIPVVHGWAHANHAPKGQKKAEFGAHRRTDQITTDAAQGLQQLQTLFGARLRPMFVPPWNRIAPDIVTALPGLGYTALSTFTPRKAPMAAPGLQRINTHLDPIAWKTTRSLVDPAQLIAQLTQQLQDRRRGDADAREPYGLLTHHLVHDPAIWEFTETLLLRLMDSGIATPWIAPAQEPPV